MPKETVRPTLGDTSWFVHDRFGMFIHWGTYALPARHEWVKSNEKITEEKYQKYFDHFNPDLYDPREWARDAKAAGMRYVVLTAKHHEGFCLWDSQYTDYKAPNTPCARDLVREYVDAFRAEGLHVGFYYSLIDWHHPEFLIDGLHPRRDDPDAEEKNKSRDMKKYAEYMRNQVSELLSNYGKIDVIWFDFSYSGSWKDTGGYRGIASMHGKGKEDWESEKLIALVRSLQLGIIIDNRTEIDQDLWTPEQWQPDTWIRDKKTGERVVWEACQTFSGSWGYHRDESTWKSPEMLVRMLVNTVSCGGNLLMNVGPTARGAFDSRAKDALGAYADWMRVNSRSIYGCTQADDFTGATPPDCRFTQNGDRLYLHIFAWPFRHIILKGMAGKFDYMQFLHDASEVKFRDGIKRDDIATPDDVAIELPPVKPNVIVPVIEIFLK